MYGGENIKNYVQYPEDEDKTKNLWRIIGSYQIDDQTLPKLISQSTSSTSTSSLTTDLTSFYNILEDKEVLVQETNKFNCFTNTCAESTYSNIGLLTDYEYNQIGGVNSYLATTENYYINSSNGIKEVTSSGITNPSNTSGLKPTIYLQTGVQVTGSGTVSDPYIISPASDINLISYTLNGQATDKTYAELLKTNVVNQIQSKGFSFSDLRLSLDYNAVTNLLMGEHIYGDRKYGLRELIQNSIDACKTMEESATKMEKFRYQNYQPYISVILDKDRKKVMVMDNGSGMSIDILKKYFLNVGVSYYASDDYRLQDREYSPIGHYGIGFLACFMLSDKVEVNTVYYNEQKMNRISFERNSEYICLTYEDTVRQQGTEIILDYDQCLSVFNNNIERLVSFIENNFLDCGIPIKISTMEKGVSMPLECNIKRIETIIAENICLSEYLSGIEAFIDCSYKQINFAKYLSDINGYESYCYNEEEYSVDEENISIKNFVKDGKITFLKIPIITEDEESEFLKAYDVLEDYQEALDKIGNYEAINIWGDEDEFEDYDFIIEESSESIIGGYTLGGFRNQFHHGSLTPVKPEIIKKGVVTGESNAVLPYNEENTFKGRFRWENTDTCYVKNVLLSGLRIKIPYLVDGVILKGAVINIFNREFIPNVSRNNISASQQEKLSYAIGKAIHLWIRDHAELSTEQKALLDVFIETKYKETNYCLR